MDSLQQQIIALEDKINQLYQIVEHMSDQMTTLLSDGQPQVMEPTEQLLGGSNSKSIPRQRGIDSVMEHKDILADADEGVSGLHAGNIQEVSPEIQIRRLNTQLTAAYNRIAALEEQLLARHIHF